MAQVRKFNTGGKTVKIGGYTVDSNNKEDIELLESMSMNPEYGGLARSVLSHLTNPGYNNTYEMYVTQDGRFVTSGELQEEKDKYMNKRLQKSTSKKPNWWNDTFAGRDKEAWARSGADFMSAFEALRSEKKEEKGKDTRKKITGVYNIGDGDWVYNENGTWSINSPENARLLTQVRWLEEYFNTPEKDREKYYDVSALDPDELEGWLQLRATTTPYDLSKFKAGLTRLTDNDDFYQQYRWFGFNPGSKEEREEREAAQTKEKNAKTIKDTFKWEGAENDFTIDKNGNIIATKAFKEKLGLTGPGSYWFNDSWNRQLLKSGSNPYSDLHKYILWNDGRLYKENDILPLLNETDYHEYINDNNARDAQSILKTWWEPEYDFETNSPFGYTMVDIKSPLTWDDQTDKSKNRSGKQLVSTKDVPVIEYWVSIPGDPFGRRERKYAYIDPDTKEVAEDLTAFQLEQLKDKLGISKDAFGNFKYRDDVNFGQAIIDNLLHESTVGNGWELWKDSRKGNYWFGYGSDGVDPGLARIPQTVYDLLNNTKAAGSDKTWWDQLQKNHSKDWNDYRRYLYDALLSLNTDPRTSDQILNDLNWTDLDYSNIWKINLFDAINGTYDAKYTLPKEYKWIGYWSSLVPLLDEIKKSSDYDQRSYFRNYPTDPSVLLERAGGILKFQSGGIKAKHNPKKESKKPTITRSNDKWTSADSWELAATAGDVIAAITTIIDPTNVGGAVASLGATAADFVSDWKRDGFQWSDAGKAGLNLLMDAATLIPVAGDAIAVGRAAKAVEKMMPLLRTAIKLGAINGIGETTIGLLNKVSNGEDLTLDDWRSIANTLNGAISFKRLGFKKSPTKKVTKTFGDLKSTDGKSIKLNQTALENIKKADPDLRLSKTQEAIVAEHKKSYPADKDLSKEDILAKYEIPTKSESKKWYKPWDRNKVPDLGATKTTKEQLSTEELKEYNKNKGSFGKWWSGSGDLQQAYYKQMMLGEVPTVTKTVKQQYYDVPSGFGLRAPFVQKLVPKVKDVEWTIQQPRTFTISQTVPGEKLKLNAYNWGLDAWDSNPREQFAYHPVGYDNPAQYTPVLKEGGVLKAKGGFNWSNLLKSDIKVDVDKSGTSTMDTSELNIDNIGKVHIPAYQWSDLSQIKFDPSQVKTNYAVDHNNQHAQSDYLKQLLAKESSALIPDTENEFLKAKRRIADAHYLRQKLAAAKQRKDAYAFYDKYADALSQRHVDAPNIISNNRFIDFRSDAARRTGSQYLSTIDRFNNADSGVTLAGKLSGLENWSKFNSENNDNLAEAAQKQDEMSRQTRVQQNLYDTEARNQNNELLINSNLAELSGKFGADQTYNVTQANIDDAKSTEIQTPLMKMGQLKAQNEQTAMAYEEKAAAAKDAETRKAYLNLANKVRSDKFYKTQVGALGYYPYLVKKGGTLRPIHEQMLINNQKLVARAVEKINDNTMKILLKLLS